MELIEFILSLYTKDLTKVATLNGETFSAWYIHGMSKIEVETQFTQEEIESIYYSGL